MHSTRKTIANTGTGTCASPCRTPRRVKYQPTPSTTGSSRNTRNNLTITAVLPTGSDTAYPAPTTWATSCMVAPSITPVVCASKPVKVQSEGYNSIVRVASAFTATTTKAMSAFLPLYSGTTVDVASVADAPQTAVPAPTSAPKPGA